MTGTGKGQGPFSWLRSWLEDERAAWQWLTVVPIGSSRYAGDDAVFPRALRAFPLVGALIGALGALVLSVLHAFGISEHLAAFLSAAVVLFITGGLHEDGLADFADAHGGCDRERRLLIMRDSRIGTYGVLALVMVVLLPGLAVADIMQRQGMAAAMIALCAAHALSRLAAVWVLAALPPARSTGQSRAAGRPDADVLRQAMIIAFLVALLPSLLVFGGGFIFKATVAASLAAMGLMAQARRLLGGQTGDVAGAAECVFRTVWLIMLTF